MLRRFERVAPDADEEALASISSVVEGVRRALDGPDGPDDLPEHSREG